MDQPPVAIVVCTLNRPAHLTRTLNDVLSQAPLDAEVVVVDQSTPELRAVGAWRSDPRVRVLSAAPGLPSARNLGVRITTAEKVVFFDDDVGLDPGCIDAHLAALRRPGVGAVVGRIHEAVLKPNSARVRNDLGFGGRMVVNLSGDRSGPIQTVKGANMSFRRDALVAAGGFDAGFGGTAFLEDADVSLRVRAAGYEVWYAAGASLTHFSAPSGGVRMSDELSGWWRFHNTGRLVRRHRGNRGAVAMAAVFGVIAARDAWRSPRRVVRLMRGMLQGWAREDGVVTD